MLSVHNFFLQRDHGQNVLGVHCSGLHFVISGHHILPAEESNKYQSGRSQVKVYIIFNPFFAYRSESIYFGVYIFIGFFTHFEVVDFQHFLGKPRQHKHFSDFWVTPKYQAKTISDKMVKVALQELVNKYGADGIRFSDLGSGYSVRMFNTRIDESIKFLVFTKVNVCKTQ